MFIVPVFNERYVMQDLWSAEGIRQSVVLPLLVMVGLYAWRGG
jgi:hypothetical protein